MQSHQIVRKGVGADTGNAGHFASVRYADPGTDIDLDMTFLGEDDEMIFGEIGDSVESPTPRSRRGARTDIHRPGHPGFNPQAYSGPHGVFYLGTNEERELEPDGGEAELRAATDRLHAQGYSIGYGSPQQCGHCGSAMLYSAVLTHPESREYIFVGEDCLNGTFGMEADEFAELREATKQARINQARKARIAQLVDEHPLLADLTYPQLADSDFYDSLARKLARDGALSDRQIEAVEKALTRDIDRRMQREADAARKEQLREQGVRVPTGKTAIEGTITTTKIVTNDYGSTLKMRVESPEGWAVWGTVPSSIDDPRGIKGAVVRFDASVEESRDDQLFGFFKRPTKASVVTSAPRESADEVYERVMLVLDDHQDQAETALAELEKITADWPDDLGSNALLKAQRMWPSGRIGTEQDVPAEHAEQVHIHLETLREAHSALLRAENQYREEHHWVQLDYGDAKRSAELRPEAIAGQREAVEYVEKELAEATEQGQDAKTISQIKRRLTQCRKGLVEYEETADQVRAEADRAKAEFEKSRARMEEFARLNDRYRYGR